MRYEKLKKKNKAIKNYVKKAEEKIAEGKYDWAGDYYEKAYELDPENEELKNKTMDSYQKHAEKMSGEEKYGKAGDYYERVLELDPENEEIEKKALENYSKWESNEKASGKLRGTLAKEDSKLKINMGKKDSSKK